MKNYIFIAYIDEGIENIALVKADNEIDALITIIKKGIYWCEEDKWCEEDMAAHLSIREFAEECLKYIRSDANHMDGDSKAGIYFKEIEFLEDVPINKEN